MLLSIYASYHWAKSKNYLVKIAVFVILVSFLSAYLSFVFLTIFSVLSFPFYAYIGERIPPFYTEEFMVIRLFAMGGIETESFMVAFFNFLLVNLLGMALGYAASKIVDRIPRLGTTKYWNLLGFILGVIFIGVGEIILLYTPRLTKSEWHLLLESGLIRGDGSFLFLFGILVLTIVVGKILWSKLSETPKEEAIKQVPNG